MDKLKEHLDKIVGVAIILACLGWIVSRHLAENSDRLSAEELQGAIDTVKAANPGMEAAKKAVPNYGAAFANNMRRVEPDVTPARMTSWAFHAIPGVTTVEPEEWTVGVQRFGAAEKAAADTLADELKLKGFPEAVVEVLPAAAGGGIWPVIGKFRVKGDAQIQDIRQRLEKAGYKGSVVKLVGKDVDVGTTAILAGVVSRPQLTVKGVYIGKAVIDAKFSADDKNFARRWLLVWRRKAGEDKWPAEALVVCRVEKGERDKVTVTPAEGAAGSVEGMEISETALQAREGYEYRALAAASFVKEAVVDPALRRLPEIDRALGEQTYAAAEYSGPVKVEIPGDVQVQFQAANRDDDGKAVEAVFNLKRFIADSDPVTTIVSIKLKGRITGSETKRIAGKQVKVVFDSEANLVNVVWEKRSVSGVPTDIEVAVIEDIRTGKQHKLDKAKIGDENWWPKAMAVQAAPPDVRTPGTKPPDTPTPTGPRRGPSTGTQPVTPTTVTPKPPVTTPKPPDVPKPPVRPEDTGKPPLTGPVAPPPAGGDQLPVVEMGPDGKPKDPGPPPTIKDLADPEQKKKMDAWRAAREAYDRYTQGQQETGRK